MSSKISMQNLILHINNVMNACVLSSVTVCKLKKYLKHKFKDALPCDNELDAILEKTVSRARDSQALKTSLTVPVESNYKTSSDSLNGKEIRDQNFQNQIVSKKEVLSERKIFKRIYYHLKNGQPNDPNICLAIAVSLNASETKKIFKPLLINKVKEKEKKQNKIKKSVKQKTVPAPRKRKVPQNDNKIAQSPVPKKDIKISQSIKNKLNECNRFSWRKPHDQKMEFLKEGYPSLTDEQLEIIIISSSDSKEAVLRCQEIIDSSSSNGHCSNRGRK